jgi:acetoacetyl-[acyl-carrier protein] synthase
VRHLPGGEEEPMPQPPLRTPNRDLRWPVVAGFGGIDAAGRWGGPVSPAFESMVHDRDELPAEAVVEQLRLMERCRRRDDGSYDADPYGESLDPDELARLAESAVRENLFVRRVPFVPDETPCLHRMKAREVLVARTELPRRIPEGWSLSEGPDEETVRVRMEDRNEVFTWTTRGSAVSSAGSIPEGFVPFPDTAPGPAKRRVARNLWLGLWAVNDALRGTGLEFAEIAERIPQNEVGIYFASAMGQVGPRGFYGYVRAHIFGERPQSTQVPFSLTNTPGAFVAAYTTGSIGHISSDIGACATFMLNLHNATRDIASGRRRFAIVGACDAAVYPWTISGYDVMNALARDEDLPTRPDGRPDYRLASRPFGNDRLGFVIGEGAFAAVVVDRELALELGLPARGLLCDVQCHSDGWKKSISGPGIGDYPAFQRVLATVAREFGIDALRHRSFVSAHGSSTPQNGVTEGALYRKYAEIFGVDKWRITAPKSFVGHSMGAAGGVQSIANLLSLERGVIPRIRNLDEVGVDPALEHPSLDFLIDNHEFEHGDLEIALAVSKGFGGFNVAEAMAGPRLARAYLLDEASSDDAARWERKVEERRKSAAADRESWLGGDHMIRYDSNRPITVEQLEVPGVDRLEVEGYHPFEFEAE